MSPRPASRSTTRLTVRARAGDQLASPPVEGVRRIPSGDPLAVTGNRFDMMSDRISFCDHSL
jgi:hypothetical protein